MITLSKQKFVWCCLDQLKFPLCVCVFASPLLSGLRSEPQVMFVLCRTDRRQPQWGESGSNWLHKQQQEEAGLQWEAAGGGGEQGLRW